MKTHVLIVSEFFGKGHFNQGEPTNFKSQILDGIKLHTIRKNVEYWKPRIKEVQEGLAVLSIRKWSGKPYNSKQIEIVCLERKHGVAFQYLRQNSNGLWVVDGQETDLKTIDIAKNDGLSLFNFEQWFKDYDMGIPMALIHFTHHRYYRFNLNYRNISNIVFGGIEHSDAPKYCNAFIETADYEEIDEDGNEIIRELTDEEVEWINENESGFVHESLCDYLN